MLKFGHLDENHFLTKKWDLIKFLGEKMIFIQITKFQHELLLRVFWPFPMVYGAKDIYFSWKNRWAVFGQHLGNIYCLNVALTLFLPDGHGGFVGSTFLFCLFPKLLGIQITCSRYLKVCPDLPEDNWNTFRTIGDLPETFSSKEKPLLSCKMSGQN